MAYGRNWLEQAEIYEVGMSFASKTLKTLFISVAEHPDAKTLFRIDLINEAHIILDILNM